MKSVKSENFLGQLEALVEGALFQNGTDRLAWF
jgi:hypothetical protein